MRRMIAAALLVAGLVPAGASGVEWNGFARRVGIFSSAGYHVYDACPELHTNHTELAHKVNGWYYGGHPKYQLHSPNAGFYSTQWCQIAPFGPSYGGLHNYTSSCPYRGVYPLNGCATDCAPAWSDVEPIQGTETPEAETVQPTEAAPANEAPAKEPAKPTARKRNGSRVTQTSQPAVRPVR